MKGTEWGSWEEDLHHGAPGLWAALGGCHRLQLLQGCSDLWQVLSCHKPCDVAFLHLLHGSGHCSTESSSLLCSQPSGFTSLTFKNLKARSSLQWKLAPATAIHHQSTFSHARQRWAGLTRTRWQLRHWRCCQGTGEPPPPLSPYATHPPTATRLLLFLFPSADFEGWPGALVFVCAVGLPLLIIVSSSFAIGTQKLYLAAVPGGCRTPARQCLYSISWD